jgi:hypothetical protein
MHNFKERRSLIWIHGFGLIEISSQKKYWACKLCDNIRRTYLNVITATGNALDHLDIEYYISRPKRPRDIDY